MAKNKMGNPEFLSEDILDEYFVKCFIPIHTVQAFLGCTRVDIRDYFVSPTTIFQMLYSCAWLLLSLLSLVNANIFYYNAFFDINKVVYYVNAMISALMYVSYASNIIQVRFLNREENVNLYLTLQRIDRSLKLGHFKSLNDTQFLFTLIIVLAAVLPFISGYLFYNFSFLENPVLNIFLMCGILSLYLELILAGSMIYYLGVRLRFLTEVAKLNILLKKENKIPGVDYGKWELKEDYRIIPHENDHGEPLGLKNFLRCLKTILKAFKTVAKLFRFQVFNVAAMVFFRTLLVVEALVIGFKSQIYPVSIVVTATFWILFHFSLLTGLVLTVEWFKKQASYTKTLCIYALSIYFEGPIFKGAKEILRLIESDAPVFSVYDIFVVDKMLPLNLIGIITGYVVVILQFTL